MKMKVGICHVTLTENKDIVMTITEKSDDMSKKIWSNNLQTRQKDSVTNKTIKSKNNDQRKDNTSNKSDPTPIHTRMSTLRNSVSTIVIIFMCYLSTFF